MAVKGTFEETDEIARCYSMGYPAETLKKKFDCDSVRWLVRSLEKNFGEDFVQRLKPIVFLNLSNLLIINNFEKLK